MKIPAVNVRDTSRREVAVVMVRTIITYASVSRQGHGSAMPAGHVQQAPPPRAACHECARPAAVLKLHALPLALATGRLEHVAALAARVVAWAQSCWHTCIRTAVGRWHGRARGRQHIRTCDTSSARTCYPIQHFAAGGNTEHRTGLRHPLASGNPSHGTVHPYRQS